MRTDQTSPKLRIRREALRRLTVSELTLVAAGTWAHQRVGEA